VELDYQTWMLVFLRISAFLLVLPFFSATNFPVTIRVALGALTALLVAPMMPHYGLAKLGLFSVIGVMAQEVGVGLLLGFISRMVFYAADLAGNFVATELGLNLGQIFNPMAGSSSQLPGTILFFLAAIVMLTLDLHHWVLMGFARTYDVLPMGHVHLNGMLFEAVLRHTGRIFVIALQICAPVLAASFVVTVIFAVLSRAVPQMNVFTLSFSFRIVAGLAVFGFTLQLTAQYVTNYLNALPDDLFRVAQMLGTK